MTVSTAQADPLATQDKAKQIWQVLDYLAVDYGRSVKDGHVANEAEYAEMQEFAQAAERQLTELPPTPAAPELAKEAAALRASIAEKAPPETVGEQARKLASGLLAAYPVPMAPGKLPDLQGWSTTAASASSSDRGIIVIEGATSAVQEAFQDATRFDISGPRTFLAQRDQLPLQLQEFFEADAHLTDVFVQ